MKKLLAALLLVAFSSPAWAFEDDYEFPAVKVVTQGASEAPANTEITLVTNRQNASSGTLSVVSTTFPTINAGEMPVCVVTSYSNPIIDLYDSAGSSYSYCTSRNVSGDPGESVAIFYNANHAGGSNVWIEARGAGSDFITIMCGIFKDQDTTPTVVGAAADNTGTSPDSGNLSVSVKSLLVGGIAYGGPTSFTKGASDTLIYKNDNNSFMTGAFQYRIVNAGTVSSGGTLADSVHWAMGGCAIED